MENKIPTHDPYTGELNPYYEELTGEKNPLSPEDKIVIPTFDMKGKLIKTGDEFLLKDLNGETLAITSGTMEGRMISLKNCQTIENGYGLVDIKKKIFNGFDGCPDSFTLAAVERTIEVMMELMGDKKFSDEDIKIAYNRGSFDDSFNVEKYIQSIQQTEWDVEIVEECLDKNCDGINKKGECITTGKPKLDSNNCLILKKL